MSVEHCTSHNDTCGLLLMKRIGMNVREWEECPAMTGIE